MPITNQTTGDLDAYSMAEAGKASDDAQGHDEETARCTEKIRARSSSLIMLVDERSRAYIASMTKKPTEPFITDLDPLVRGDPPIVQDDGQYQLGIHDDALGPFETRAFAQAVATSQHRGK